MFKHMSIRTQIISSFTLVTGLLAVTVYMGMSSLKSSNESLRTVYEDRSVPLAQLGQIKATVMSNHALLMEAALDNSPATVSHVRREVNANIESVGKLWKQYTSTYLTEEEKALVKRFEEHRGRFVQQGLKPGLAMISSAKPEEIRRFVLNDLDALFKPVRKDLEELTELQVNVARQEYENASAAYIGFSRTASIIAILAVIGSVLMGYFLLRSIVLPLRRATGLSNAIAKGDMDTSLEIGNRNEIGSMLLSLKEMQTSIKSLLHDVNHMVVENKACLLYTSRCV